MALETLRTPEHMFELFESCVAEAKTIYLKRNAEGKILASNGLVSEYGDNELLSKVVRTKTFKNWFGDWENNPAEASVAVYETTGEPRIVFHGTKKDIPIVEGLDVNKSNRSTEMMFTTSRANSLREGTSSARRSNFVTDNASVTYPCFINLRPLPQEERERQQKNRGRPDWRVTPYSKYGSSDGNAENLTHYSVELNENIMHLPFNTV